MKKFLLGVFVLALATGAGLYSFSAEAGGSSAAMPSPNLVISQFQAGGSTSANDEFVEIHNSGSAPVDLNGYRVVYRSATGTNDVGNPFAVWTTSTILQPGQYLLVASTGYDGGVTPDVTYNPTTCACSMGAGGGGLAIRNGANDTGTIIDSVAWGTASATHAFIETAVTTAAGNDNAKVRAQDGCQDTDNNANDFATLTPAAARNGASPLVVCSGGGTTLFAALAANPTTVSPGSNVLLTVTVVPATTPPSTNITVVGNLESIGGASNQTFFDDGTNGDTTPGDNIYTFLAPIPLGTSGGSKLIVAVAADAQARFVNMQQTITVNAPLPNEDPLIFGNPSGATTDVANENNYLMPKPQYTLSYNRSKATANWVAWRLDSSWIGGTPRQDDFRPDPALPTGWYQVQDADYSGSGYDRGHMCPSGDRTNSVANNSATFLMTNIVPQLGANNQGSWNDFENYTRSLAQSGSEIYIISGVQGSIGTIAQGRIVVPAYTWKVILVLPNGSNDVQRVTRATRAFGIIVPNFPPVNQQAPWRTFRVTVNAVEVLTGYDFFTAIPKNTQELIERKRDLQ